MIYPDILEETGKVVDLVWSGEEANIVFALTESTTNQLGGRLWRSKSRGEHRTWAEVTRFLLGSTPQTPEALSSPDYGVREIIASPVSKKNMFFRGLGKYHWVSLDGGETFEQIPAPGLTAKDNFNIKMHPTEKDWFLMLVRRPYCRNAACGQDLFFTNDFGKSFSNLTEVSYQHSKGIVSFVDFDWGYNVLDAKSAEEEAKEDAKGTGGRYSLEPKTILATAYESRDAAKHGNVAFFQGWDTNVHFVRTDSLFETKYMHVVSCGNQFEVMNGVIFLAVAADCPVSIDAKGSGKFEEKTDTKDKPVGGRSSIMLYTSTDQGKTFEQACLPINVEDRGYSMRDAGKGAVMVTVDHDEEDAIERQAPIGNVYLSGGGGHSDSPGKFALFSLALPRVHYRGLVDLSSVEGVDGVFIANQLDDAAYDDPALRDRKLPFEDFLRSRISFNRGARWDPLRAPEHDVNGQPVVCHMEGGCPLHVHSYTSWNLALGAAALPAEYASKSAPGLIMGLGNIGRYLSRQRQDINTYLSRDAGHTWEEVRKGAHIFEYGDHGGVIVMARHAEQGPTDEIIFSLDGGRCWEPPIKLNETINIDNIRTEERGATTSFIVHGSQCKPDPFNNQKMNCGGEISEGRKTKGVIYQFDVMKLFPKPLCRRPTDFEFWSPATAHCILGKNVTFERAKPEAGCYHGESYERKVETKVCSCEWSDLMCDYGYAPKRGFSTAGFMGICEKIPGLEAVDVSPTERSKYGHAGDGIRGTGGCPIVDRGTYVLSSSGTRRITGDHCEDLSKYINDTDGAGTSLMGPPQTDNRRRGSAVGRAMITLLVIGLIGAALFVSWTRILTAQQRASFLDSAEDMMRNPLEGAKRLFGVSPSPFTQARFRSLPGDEEADLGTFQPLASDGLGLDDLDAPQPSPVVT